MAEDQFYKRPTADELAASPKFSEKKDPGYYNDLKIDKREMRAAAGESSVKTALAAGGAGATIGAGIGGIAGAGVWSAPGAAVGGAIGFGIGAVSGAIGGAAAGSEKNKKAQIAAYEDKKNAELADANREADAQRAALNAAASQSKGPAVAQEPLMANMGTGGGSTYDAWRAATFGG